MPLVGCWKVKPAMASVAASFDPDHHRTAASATATASAALDLEYFQPRDGPSIRVRRRRFLPGQPPACVAPGRRRVDRFQSPDHRLCGRHFAGEYRDNLDRADFSTIPVAAVQTQHAMRARG